MKHLMITDLTMTEELDRKAMAGSRGGIATVAFPIDGGPADEPAPAPSPFDRLPIRLDRLFPIDFPILRDYTPYSDPYPRYTPA